MPQTGIAPGISIAQRYTVRHEIGRGGMATVLIADDARYGRPVAIKVLHHDLSLTMGAERFLREIEIAAKLQHPHILPLFDSGEHDGSLYYVMPYIDGPSLRDRMNDGTPISIAEATSIARDVAGALAYSHDRGIVHRDIKPENIMLSKGVAVVADFGIAKAVGPIREAGLTMAGIAIGTPAYMSPEQCLGETDLDGRTDLYALGCVLYEMLAGVPPFVAEDHLRMISRKLTVDPQPLGERRKDIPGYLERAVMVALARTPSDRFAQCSAFQRALEPPTEVLVPRRESAATAIRGGGNESTFAGRSPKLGPLAIRSCNRWRQVNSFDAAFRAGQQRRTGTPQFHVIPGPEQESHDSLITRLIATRLQHFATELGGEDGGTVKGVRVPWPDSDPVDTRKQDLVISLFREISAGYMGHQLTAGALSRQPSVASRAIVAIHHDVRSSTWDRETEALLHWYINDFWGALAPQPGTPLFVVFLKVIHDSDSSRSRWRFWRRQSDNRGNQAIDQALRELAAMDSRCPIHITTALSPVGVNDVKDWFGQLGVQSQDLRRDELIRSLFHQTPTRSMVDVEVALEQVHKKLVEEYSRERGVGI